MSEQGNIMRFDFDTFLCDSEGKPIAKSEEVSVLFNKNIISPDEVEELINSGKYEYDERIIVTTQTRADYLKGIIPDKKEKE